MKAPRDIQKRLAAALRGTATGREPGPPHAIRLGRRLVSRKRKDAPSPRVRLEDTVDGREIDAQGFGRTFLVESRSPAPTPPPP